MTSALEHSLRQSIDGLDAPRTREEYDAIDALSFSKLKRIGVSPRAYRAAVEKPTAAKARGTVAHMAILEPDRFATEIVVYNGDRRGNAWKAFKEEHSGRTILKTAEYDEIQRMADALRDHAPASALLKSDAEPEATIQWEYEGIGACKGRLDLLANGWIADLKTTSFLHSFGNQAAKLDYHTRAAWYVDGLHRSGGPKDLPYWFIVVEAAPPYDVAVFELGTEALAAGRQRYQKWLDRLHECLLEKEWPGAFPATTTLELPAWALADAPPVTLTVGGEDVEIS